MWKYNPQGVDENIGLTNSHVSLSVMAIKYPATVLVYLSNYPEKGKIKQILYIGFWVLIYGVNELIDISANLFKYFNGWNFWWSLLFDVVAFVILRIHFNKPLLAWLLSFAFMLFLWNIFNVPSTVFR